MRWTFTNDCPIYLQIVEELQRRILSAFYQPGDRFPSVRDLANEAKVNPNTMQKALLALEKTGLVYAEGTSGRFVTSDTELLKATRQTLASKKTETLLCFLQGIQVSPQQLIVMLQQMINKEDSTDAGKSNPIPTATPTANDDSKPTAEV